MELDLQLNGLAELAGSPPAGEPTNETLFTTGTLFLLPSTLWSEPGVNAVWVRSPSVVPSAAALMLPPFRLIASPRH